MNVNLLKSLIKDDADSDFDCLDISCEDCPFYWDGDFCDALYYDFGEIKKHNFGKENITRADIIQFKTE